MARLRCAWLTAAAMVGMLAPSVASTADLLKLKDGSVFSGTLVKREGGTVWFRHTKFGKIDDYVYFEHDISEVQVIEVAPRSPQKSDRPAEESPAAPAEKPAAPRPAEPQVRAAVEEVVAELPADVERVREQWRRLAPYLSMKNELSLVEVTPATVKEAFDRVRTYADEKFNAHADLERVGPPLMKFLIGSEARVIPCFRADVGLHDVFTDPEGCLAAAFLELASRQMESQVLFLWQREYDQIAADGYERMLPLVRALAARPDGGGGAIEVSSGGGGLQLVNGLGKRLTDATVIARFQTLDGREQMHYFFVPEWEMGAAFDPRASADWYGVGLRGTTSGSVQVYAREVSTPHTTFELPDNIGWTVGNSLRRLTVESPALAIKGLNRARQLAPPDDQALRKQIVQLLDQAKDNRIAAIERLQAQIDRLNKALDAPERPQIPPGRREARGAAPWSADANAREFREARRKYIKQQIDKLRAQVRELRGG